MNDTILEVETYVKNLVIDKKFNEALDYINNIGDKSTVTADIILSKAIALNGLREKGKALEFLESISDQYNNIAIWHQAGEYALELGFSEKSLDYLTKAINLSLDEKNDYYLSTCYLERAYIYINQGETEKARIDLDSFKDEDTSIFWLKNIEALNKVSLRKKIKN